MIELKIDTLYQAVKKGIDIELRPTGQSSEGSLFSSRFLECDEEEKKIIIDDPKASPGIKALEIDDEIVVHFFLKESPFIFYSKVLGLTTYKPLGEPTTRALVIALPEVILNEERRDFHKVGTPAFAVDVKVIESEDKRLQIRGSKIKVTCLNISGGGIAVEREDGNLPLSPGDILELNIHLPDHTVSMEGEVMNVYQFENSERIIFGIRFVQRSMDRLAFRRNEKTIVRYVMKRERELLTK
jgi:c-di-GMP-binding flagellar brake protein YcgR